MKKSIFALGLALALAGLGFTNVFAVDGDTSSNNSQTAPAATDTTNTNTAQKTGLTVAEVARISSSDATLKNVLVKTLDDYIADPDTSTQNGRYLEQLVHSLGQGHSLSVALNINDDPELEEDAYLVLLSGTEGLNLASVQDVSFVVTDLTDSTLSVSLKQLSSPVTVTLPIPDRFKSALASRKVEIIHITSDDEGDYFSTMITDTGFSSSGDVTFTTSDFSVFGLIYDGAPISVTVDGDTTVPVPSTSAGGSTVTVATADTNTVVAPNTAGFFGIELTVFNLFMLIGVSLVVIALTAYAIKRAYLRNKISLK